MRVTLLCTGLLCSLAASAAAQAPGDVASSGMAQGQAAITTRSDVQMSLESAEGTTAARLRSVGALLTHEMGAIRACYERVTQARPTVTGNLAIRASWHAAPGGQRNLPGADLDVTDNVHDAELVRCVTRRIGAPRVAPADRPAGVVIHLTFGNSAARGVASMQANRADSTSVVVEGDTARARTGGGEITLTARGPSDPLELRAVGTLFLDHVAALLDCRRRAGRRGANPEGDITLTFAKNGTRLSRPTVDANTVANRDAGSCVTRALGSLRLTTPVQTQRINLVIHFAGPSPL